MACSGRAAARWENHLPAVLAPEQPAGEDDRMLLRIQFLSRDGPAQQFARLFFQRAPVRRSLSFQPGMQGIIDVANEQAGHFGPPGPLLADASIRVKPARHEPATAVPRHGQPPTRALYQPPCASHS